MRIHKRDSLNFAPTPKHRLTAYDIANKARILAWQKVVIRHEDSALAVYKSPAAIERDEDLGFMQRTVEFVTWCGDELIVFVGDGV